MIHLRAPDANEITWLQAGHHWILSALNAMAPFPNLEPLRWVRANRPDLLETVRFTLKTTGAWEPWLGKSGPEVRQLLTE